jgi:hypothetical protein
LRGRADRYPAVRVRVCLARIEPQAVGRCLRIEIAVRDAAIIASSIC